MRTPDSLECVMQSDSAANETCNAPGTPRGGSPEIFPPTDGICDRTDTCFPMKPDAEISYCQTSPFPTSPRCTKHNLRHNPKPNCDDDEDRSSCRCS